MALPQVKYQTAKLALLVDVNARYRKIKNLGRMTCMFSLPQTSPLSGTTNRGLMLACYAVSMAAWNGWSTTTLAHWVSWDMRMVE
jgi:hypothetical protein